MLDTQEIDGQLTELLRIPLRPRLCERKTCQVREKVDWSMTPGGTPIW